MSDDLARELGTTVKALAPLGGTTPLALAISAARSAGARRVVVIGGDEVRMRYGREVDAVIPESSEGRENVRRAIDASGAEPFLLLASDLPFLNDAGTRAFVTAASDADVALPLAEASDYERTFPGAPPHATRLGRERVVNGSIVYFGPGVALRVLDISQKLFDARKSLVRMAVLLGPALLLRFVTRTLTVTHVENRAAQLFGLRALAVRSSDPGLCFDIDSIEDYRYAARRIAAR